MWACSEKRNILKYITFISKYISAQNTVYALRADQMNRCRRPKTTVVKLLSQT
jgi:predicted transcriptional regulator